MTDKYISHARAVQALDVFASLQDKSVEDLDAIEILEQYIKEREWMDQRLLTALDMQQRELEKFYEQRTKDS